MTFFFGAGVVGKERRWKWDPTGTASSAVAGGRNGVGEAR